MNSISFVGNLGGDPVLRESASGTLRATFTVAVNEGTGDAEKTHWVNVTAFGSLGENLASSLRKGQRVLVIGRLDTYKREVQINGEDKDLMMTQFIASAVGPDLRWAKASVTKVIADRVDESDRPVSAAPKAASNGAAKSSARKSATAVADKPQDDDNPF